MSMFKHSLSQRAGIKDATEIAEAGEVQEIVHEPVATESLAPEVTEVPTAEGVAAAETTQTEVAVETLTAEVPAEVVSESAVEALVPEVTEEAPAAEAAVEALEPTPEVEVASEETGAAPAPAAEQSFARTNRVNSHRSISTIEQTYRHERRVRNLHKSLNDLQMIMQFTNVAVEHRLSAPLVAAFHATPGFEAAVESFPDATVYNIVAEHPTSVHSTMGIESLDVAETQTVDVIRDKSRELVAEFSATLSSIALTVDNLKSQIAEDKDALDTSDVSDEVLETLPVYTLSHEAFTEVLSKLEEHLTAIGDFNVDELIANPEKLPAEFDGLLALVDEIGHLIGLTTCDYGLSECDKSSDYEPSMGHFGEKSITKAGLIFYLDKADAVLDALKSLADRKDALTLAVENAVTMMPQAAESDDVTYGRVEHTTLLSSYTILVTKLVRESVIVVTMLLSTIDSVLDIDDGLDEEEDA